MDEKMIDQMRKLKEIREKQIGKNGQVKSISYLGKISWKEEKNQEKIMTQKDIFLLLEENLDEYKQIIPVEKYYTEDFECLAGNNKKDAYPDPFLEKDFLEYPEILEELKKQKPEKQRTLEKIERQRVQKMADSLKIEQEKIEKVEELDLKKQILLEKEGKNKKLRGLNIKEETSLQQNMKGKTLENLLGLEKIGITNGVKLARVTTTSLNSNLEQKVTSQDAFVVICANGEMIPLGEEILRPDHQLGNNPRGESLNANIDGKVNQERITSSFLIVNGNGREYLQTSYDEQSGKEIKYAMRSNEKGEDVTIELPTQRTYYQNSEMIQFKKDRGVGTKEAKEMIERDQQHGVCSDKDITVIDADKNNDSHSHITENYIEYSNGKRVTYAELATRWGFFKNGRPDAAYAKEKVEQKKRNKKEDAIEKIVDELDEDFSDPRLGEMEIS